jgi:hypothetical protein
VKLILRRKLTAALISAIILVTIIAGSIAWEHYITRWAQQGAVAQIDRLIAQDKYFGAFVLARKAKRYIPDDPLLAGRWSLITREHSITTTPPGAKVFIGEYGRTPIERARIPFGTNRWKVEKPGFMSREVIRSNNLPGHSFDPASLEAGHVDFVLHENGTFPDDMVFVPSSELKQEYLWHGTRTIPSHL